MKDNDPKAQIVFDKNHRIEVGVSPAQVRELIEGCTTGRIPLITLPDVKGNEISLNAEAIRIIQDRPW